MNQKISGFSGEAPQGPHTVTSKTGKSKSLRVPVINKTSETLNSPISEANKNSSVVSEITGKSIENRTASPIEPETYQSPQPSQQTTEHSVAGATPQTVEILEEMAQTMDLSDDIASLLTQQRKKTDEELKTGLKKRIRGSDEESEETHKAEQRKVTEGQATGEREDDSGEEKRRDDFFKLLERMAREGQIRDLNNIINLAWGKSGMFTDITNAYNALRAAQEYFSKSPEEIIHNLSNSTAAAAEVLYKENGPDIRAGFIFGPKTDETDKYRLYVLHFEGISETFSSVMEKVNGNSKLFSQELERLIKLIQIDLKSQESTLDPAHLQQIMRELYKVQICAQIKSESDLLLRDMDTLYGSRNAEPLDLSKSILQMTQATWVDPNTFNQFVDMVHLQPGPQKVDFTQRFLALIKRLPDKLVDLEHRQKIVESGQEYLEEAIQEEEDLNN